MIDHAERQKRLGGTDVAVILGLAPKRTDHELWLEKTGRLEPWAGNDATEIGTLVEPSLMNYAEQELGELERDVVVPCEGIDFPLAAQLDGRVVESSRPVDAKTSGLVGPVYGDWGESGSDEVPDYYLVQLTSQIICAQADAGHLYALLGGRGVVSYTIPRADWLVDRILNRCGEWWQRHIVEGVEPELATAPDLEVLKRIRREADKRIDLPPSVAELVELWQSSKEEAKAAERNADAAKALLIHKLGDAESGIIPGVGELTYFEFSRKARHVDASTFRTLRLRKAKA